MPVLEPKRGDEKVLVTGANGYIAMWVVHTLLEQGYTVRGAVRSAEKGERLQEHFFSWGDKFEWVVVEDITKEGAFDEFVKDVAAIQHIASPVTPRSEDPEDFNQPAIQGTLGVLLSALKFGTLIKRVIITSSCAAILNQVTKPTVIFDETSWGDDFVRVVEEQGFDAPLYVKYRASKTLAERAAWDFYNANKEKTGWDLVSLNPSLVLGPTLQAPNSPDKLNHSLKLWFYNVFTERTNLIFDVSYSCVDVRDVAAAHVLALRWEAAGGERLIIAEGALTWEATRNLVRSMFPKLYDSGFFPKEIPAQHQSKVLFDFNSEKSKAILGLQYRDVAQVVLDTVTDFEARGWLDSPVNTKVV